MSTERQARAMEILADVLDYDTGRREAAIFAACAGDQSLRREIEELLSYKNSAEPFLEESPLSSVAAAREEWEWSFVGQRFGPYTIRRPLGRGGMGAVFLAERNDDEYERKVAIKLIGRGAGDPLSARSLRAERQILADLDHPNIARLIDGGTTEDGLPYIVMEYVEGVPVTRYCDGRRLSNAERLKLFRAICSAVIYAHQHLVIHRDIKPANILITEDGTPKLLDFGIAKLLGPAQVEGEAHTVTRLGVMTPAYASPEQIRGERVTTASDIYSLGVLLYELLTGHRPYRLAGRRPDEVARAVCEEEPERPSAAITRAEEVPKGGGETTEKITAEAVGEARGTEPRQLRRLLEGDLDNIILMAMRKEAERRYSSVEQFSEDIRRHLEGLPVRARQDWPVGRWLKFIKRNRAAAITVVAVAVVCLALGISLSRVAPRDKAARSVAVLPFSNVGGDANSEYLSDGITDSLIEALSGVRGLSVPAHNSVYRYRDQAGVDPAGAGRALGVGEVLTGKVSSEGGVLEVSVEMVDTGSGRVVWSRRYKGTASDIQNLQREIADGVTRSVGLGGEGLAARHRHVPNNEAYILYLKGRYFWNQRTGASLLKGAAFFRQSLDEDPDNALAYSGLADCYSLLGVFGAVSSQESFDKAKPAAERSVELDPDSAETHTSVAAVEWWYGWDWDRAEQEFRRAIELNPNYPTARHWHGLFLAEMGRFDDGVAEERRALELDPLSTIINADLGRVLFYARRYDESLVQYRKALEMDPGSDAIYTDLSNLYEATGMGGEFISARARQLPQPEARRARETFAAKGFEGYWRWQLARLLKQPRRPDYAFTRAEIYSRLGDRDRAFAELSRAYELRDHQMAQIKVNPALDSIRSDPRFDLLLRRINLDK